MQTLAPLVFEHRSVLFCCHCRVFAYWFVKKARRFVVDDICALIENRIKSPLVEVISLKPLPFVSFIGH